MKISIVTISFNQVRFLEESIRSVVDQDYSDVEYVLVDPGSTDGSRAIIDRYREKVSSIIYEPDNGPADGLNKGFATAQGDAFGFLNSDDILESGALTHVAKYFDTHPDVDVVSGHSLVIDAEGRIKRRFYSDHYSLNMAAYGASILSQPSTFFRSETFRRVGGFNIANRSNWDGELFVDMMLAGARFSLVPEFWSRYRVHDQGITGSGKLSNLHQLHQERMFRKIMGRELRASDWLLTLGARYVRKILNLPDAFERLRHGPVYRSTT